MPKPLPTVTVGAPPPGRAAGGMKELRPRHRPEGSSRAPHPESASGSRGGGGNSSSSHNNHHYLPQHHHHQQPPVSPSQHDISQNFDPTHIIYDSTTDTTYLRGRLLGKVSEHLSILSTSSSHDYHQFLSLSFVFHLPSPCTFRKLCLRTILFKLT